MADQTGLKEEIADDQRAISKLNEDLKAIQGFIVADERNVQHAVEAIRINARQSLDNYRTSLAIKQTELQDIQGDLQRKKSLLTRMEEVRHKEREVQHFEREKERITNLHEKARADLQRLQESLDAMSRPVVISRCVLLMEGGASIALPAHGADLLVGCRDAADGIFPDVDLTPFGGTGSGVSRKHATMSFRNGQWTINDENSTNGTFVNGSRIAAHVPRVLSDQTKVRFGAVSAVFSSQAPPAGKTTRLQ